MLNPSPPLSLYSVVSTVYNSKVNCKHLSTLCRDYKSVAVHRYNEVCWLSAPMTCKHLPVTSSHLVCTECCCEAQATMGSNIGHCSVGQGLPLKIFRHKVKLNPRVSACRAELSKLWPNFYQIYCFVN